MLTDYYKQEIRLLNEIAQDFAQDNPALNKAVMSINTDPDTSRILQGVAFLTANIRQELDSQFPKLLLSLAQIICPQYIRPMASATIIAFEPKPSIAKPLEIAAHTYIDSKESAQGVARFRTTENISLLPVKLTNVTSTEQKSNSGITIKLSFELINQTLDQLDFDNIRFYLGGEYSDASDMYSLLLNQLTGIRINANGESYLAPTNLVATGFQPSQSLYPQPKGMMPAFDLLQQYFLFPQKFLFVDLNLKQWLSRGAGSTFDLYFDCKKPNFALPKLNRDHFVLHATPAVNLFEQDAQAILINPDNEEYQLLPRDETQQQIYSVEHVESNARGMDTHRSYQLFGGFSSPQNTDAVYELQYQQSSRKDAPDVYLKLAFPPNNPVNSNEILKTKLVCSNSQAAEKLLPGDICIATSNTPELATFRNVIAPTKARNIPFDGDMLWQLISHLSLNYLSITDHTTLQAILRQYVAPDNRDKSGRLINEKKITAISNVVVKAGESLLHNTFVHGQNIKITIKSENFECMGDKYLFGSVLDRFFAATAAINVYSELTFEDFFSGECQQWPAKIGNRPLQ